MTKDGAGTRMRDPKRLIRAVKKIAYDSIREQKKSRERKKEALEPIVTRMHITLEDRFGLNHLE
jgi:hypothetical protein